MSWLPEKERRDYKGEWGNLCGWLIYSLSWLWLWFHGFTDLKTYQTINFKYVWFIMCQSYLNKVVFKKELLFIPVHWLLNCRIFTFGYYVNYGKLLLCCHDWEYFLSWHLTPRLFPTVAHSLDNKKRRKYRTEGGRLLQKFVTTRTNSFHSLCTIASEVRISPQRPSFRVGICSRKDKDGMDSRSIFTSSEGGMIYGN